jgi:ATP-dependent DNA helicase DinG
MPTSEEIYQKLLENFPFETPRSEQLAAFEHLAPWISRLFIQDFEHPLFFGIDAPTGIGKSPLALTVAKAVKALYEAEHGSTIDEVTGNETAQVWVVTQNKLLQDQYQRDFDDELFDLRGLDNYECYHDKGKTCGQSVCGRIRAKNPEDKKNVPKFCSFDCEYDRVTRQAKKAPILSLNVAKALNLLKNPRYAPPLLMIFDEGHEVESALDSEASFSISPDELQRLGLSFPHYFQDLKDLEATKEGMEELIEDCGPMRDAEEEADEASRDVRRFKKLESIITKTSETLESIRMGIEYVSCKEDLLELKPLKIHKVFERFFTFPTVFMSATLLSKRGFESMTGLDDKKLDWFGCNSPFPVVNRPIRMAWRLGAAPLNYGNLQEELPNVVLRVAAILDKHPEERGIIHTHTYKIAERLYQDLYLKYGNRILFPKTAKEQKDCLERHARTPNAVLISPSMTQGVDLRDELCRFSILTKVPWLPTNDPVVKARMDLHREWYTYKTAMTVVQAPGRGVRSMEDYAVTYLVDPGFARFFNMAKGHLPKWFQESLIMKPQGWY